MKKTLLLARSFLCKLFIVLALVLAVTLWTALSSWAEELTLMSFNISKIGTYIEWPATRIVQGLEPDVVCLQEWYLDELGPWGEDYRAWVDDAFGTEFSYYRGPGSFVNGIVSRWAITSSGSWADVEISSRYFDWAVIDIPGNIDIQVVSVHFKAGDTPDDLQTRLDEATNLKALIQANFDTNDYIAVCGDLNTLTRVSEPDLIDIFDSYLTTTDGTPEDRNHNDRTNVNRDKNFDWIIPNPLLGGTISPLPVGSYLYVGGIVFDSRVFTPLSEVPPILFGDTDSGDMDHCPIMKAYNVIPAPDKVYVMQANQGYDYNLYLYESLKPGDITYWDSAARNPSPVARDLWVVPGGNNVVDMTYLAMEDSEGKDIAALAVLKNQGGNHLLYVYNSIVPGDWTYWDAVSRNPSPLARDFWIIPAGNYPTIMTRTDEDGDRVDELVLMKNMWGAQRLFVYNAPVVGDWTYTDAFLRNWNTTYKPPELYVAKDEWFIPRYSNVVALAGLRNVRRGEGNPWEEGIASIESSWGDQNFFTWKVPTEGINTFLKNRQHQAGYRTEGNPTGQGNPQGQDLWIVTERNDIQDLAGLGADSAGSPGDPGGDYDVLAVLGNSGGDNNFWIWKTVQWGDTTYNQARTRQDGYPRTFPSIPNFGEPQAKDFWVIPAGNNIRQIAAIPAPPPIPTPTPTVWIVADFTWDPGEPEEDETVTFTDLSSTSDPPIVDWNWTFDGGNPSAATGPGPHNVTWDTEGSYTVTLQVEDSASKTDSTPKDITVVPLP